MLPVPGFKHHFTVDVNHHHVEHIAMKMSNGYCVYL